MNYTEYIKSQKWLEFRKKAIVAAGLACARCGCKSKVLQVHHLHYRTLGHESLNDVQVVCVDCHPQADREREHRDGFSTFSRKKYGDDYMPSISEMNRREEEFDEWVNGKDEY